MSVDRRMVEALAEEISKHDVDLSELTIVKTSALQDLQKEHAELQAELNGETEELSSAESHEVARDLLVDYFSSDDEEDKDNSPTEAEELATHVRRMRAKGGKWAEAAERLEGEAEELSDRSNPHPRAAAQSRQEEPQEDNSEDEMTPREKLDAALRRDIHDNKTEDMSKSPLSQNIEELSGSIDEHIEDDDEMSPKERLVEALRQDCEARE